MFICLLLLAAFQPIFAGGPRKASCIMKLHGTDIEVGNVVFESDGAMSQSIRLNIDGEPENIVKGPHGFHIHTNAVVGNSCGKESTGGHFNPHNTTHGDITSIDVERHVGDFGNVNAGDRGEINYSADIDVDESGGVGASFLGKPAIYCGPWLEKVWSDGKVETFYGEELLEVEKRKRKGKKVKKCNKRRERKGLCVNIPTFEIIRHDPDCYVPMTERWGFTLNSLKFRLKGPDSVVGRAAVLHAGRDDLGRGGDEGSAATGNAGGRIACCTLQLEK